MFGAFPIPAPRMPFRNNSENNYKSNWDIVLRFINVKDRYSKLHCNIVALAFTFYIFLVTPLTWSVTLKTQGELVSRKVGWSVFYFESRWENRLARKMMKLFNSGKTWEKLSVPSKWNMKWISNENSRFSRYRYMQIRNGLFLK